MYLEVAVTLAKDRAKDTFTYFSNKSIKPGTLVEVPFGKKTDYGIVWGETQHTKLKKILPILKVVSHTPLVTETQQKLITWLASYYQTSISSVLHLVLPDFPQKALKNFSYLQKAHDKQILLLAPTLSRLIEIENKFKSQQKTYSLYHSDQSLTERAATYQQVLFGQSTVVLATRIGLFLPFKNLTHIYLYDEHDYSYKEQHNPQFHSFTVAKALARIWEIPLTIIDPTPKIETWWQAAHDPKIKLKQTPLSLSSDQIQLIDLANESKKGNLGVISENITEALYQTLAKRQPTLLYLNKKNDGGMLFCKNCETTSYLANALTQSIIPCPSCKSDQTKMKVLNIKVVAKEVQHVLQTFGVTKGLWQVSQAGSVLQFVIPPKTDDPHQSTKTTIGIPLITIATNKILYQSMKKKFGLVGVIIVDTMLNLPEFRANESTFITLTSLSFLVKPQGKLLIQTRQPENQTLQFFRKQDYGAFANAELEDRRSLAYPPYTSLALLTFKAKTPKTALLHAEKLHKDLQAAIEATSPFPPSPCPFDLIGPFAPLHNNLEARILLKAKKRHDLTSFLQIVPKNWKIDLEPERILT